MRTRPCFLLALMLAAAGAIAAEMAVPADVVERVRTAAVAGGGGSQIALAEMYAHGLGVPRDRAMALQWSRRAAAQRVIRAYEQLGRLLSGSAASNEERREAVDWHRKAADAGRVDAQLALARALQVGTSVTPNDKQAAAWLRRAADQDDPEGAVGLAHALYRGRGVRADPKAAIDWLLWPEGEPRSDDIDSMARDFRDGDNGTHPQDPVFAQLLYSIAADAGDAEAGKQAATLLQELDPEKRAEAVALFERWRHARSANPPALRWRAQRRQAEHQHTAGDSGAALASAAMAVTLARAAFGDQSPQAATSLDELGWLQLFAKKRDAAHDSFTQVLAIRRDAQGAEHRAVIAAVHALGSERRSAGEWAQAAELQRAALTLTEKHYGVDSTQTALVLNALGTALYYSDQNEAAVAARRRELAIHRLGVPPARESELIDALTGLADGLRAIEGEQRPAAQREAEPLYRETIERIRKDSSTPHPIAAYSALEGLKLLLWDQDRYDDVVAVQQDIIATLQHQSPADAKALAAAQLDLRQFRASAAQSTRGPLGSASRLKHDRDAAAQGDVAAQLSLGNVYHAGLGVKRNVEQAAKWYRKAAEQGDMIGQYNLGILYTNGEGVPQDEALAVQWLRKSAEQGFLEAQASLGYMLEAGRGVARDTAAAVRMFRLAAEQESPNGRYNLANHLYQGLGVKQDIPEAIRLYRLAAEQEWPEAQLELARLYRNGEHMAPDRDAAITWLRRAADQGLVPAQANLSGIYATTDASEADLKRAYYWIILAAQGDEDFRAERDALRARLTTAQAAQVEQRAAVGTPPES